MADIIITTNTLKSKNTSLWSGGTISAPYLCPRKDTLSNYFSNAAVSVSGTYSNNQLVAEKNVSVAATGESAVTATGYSVTVNTALSVPDIYADGSSGGNPTVKFNVNRTYSDGTSTLIKTITCTGSSLSDSSYGSVSYSISNASGGATTNSSSGNTSCNSLGTTATSSRTIRGSVTATFTTNSSYGSTSKTSSASVYLAINKENASYAVESVYFSGPSSFPTTGGTFYRAISAVRVRGYYTSGSAGSLYNATAYSSSYSGETNSIATTVSLATGLSGSGDLNGKGLKYIIPAWTANSYTPYRTAATNCKVTISNITANGKSGISGGTYSITGGEVYSGLSSNTTSPSSGAIYLEKGVLIIITSGLSSGTGVVLSTSTSASVSGPITGEGWNAVGPYGIYFTYPNLYYYSGSGAKATSNSSTKLYIVGHLNKSGGAGYHNVPGRTSNSSSAGYYTIVGGPRSYNNLVRTVYYP